jgi:hypothetical protein
MLGPCSRLLTPAIMLSTHKFVYELYSAVVISQFSCASIVRYGYCKINANH